MASIDSWASSLAGNKNVASKATKTTGKCVFVNMDRDVESGSYKWKNPGKVYKRRKAANKQKNVPGKVLRNLTHVLLIIPTFLNLYYFLTKKNLKSEFNFVYLQSNIKLFKAL